MDPRHRNRERKRQRRLISREWFQIDLFLLSSSMNMPYISIKFYYIMLRNPSPPEVQANLSDPGLATSDFCSRTVKRSSLSLLPLPCICLCRVKTHDLNHNGYLIPLNKRGNYHTRRSVPSPIIISLLHYPQNQCGCFPLLLEMTHLIRQRYLRPFQSICHRVRDAVTLKSIKDSKPCHAKAFALQFFV